MGNDDMKFPLFFKLWFGFVFALVILSFGAFGYVSMQVVNAGPEGLGKAIGSVIHGINEASK